MQIFQIFLVHLFSGGSPSEGSKVGFDCKTDWISIPCATNTLSTSQNGTPNICVDRICGMVFNSVTTSAGILFFIFTIFFINILLMMITYLISRISFSGTASMIVSSFTKPFILQVHTDNAEGSASPQPAESNNRGFCFNFIQKPCIV